MPLSTPKTRTHLHTRAIRIQGFAREDGLWDIEGHITDNKTYAFDNEYRGRIGPDTPIHDMWLRLTLDDDYVIVDVEAVLDQTPMSMCPDIASDYKKMIGLKVGPGFARGVRERVGGARGCTHVTEMTGQMATVAFQTISVEKQRRIRGDVRIVSAEDQDGGPRKKPFILDGCHAWRSDGPAAKRFLPDFYTGPSDDEGRK